MNTPRADLWLETINLINSFGDRTANGTYLTINECVSEHHDLQRLVKTGYGAPEGETEEDRINEIEGCVSDDDFQTILDFYEDLGENIEKIKELMQ